MGESTGDCIKRLIDQFAPLRPLLVAISPLRKRHLCAEDVLTEGTMYRGCSVIVDPEMSNGVVEMRDPDDGSLLHRWSGVDCSGADLPHDGRGPMTATEIRERQAAWHAELLPKLHAIAVKHGLVPEPKTPLPPTYMGVPIVVDPHAGDLAQPTWLDWKWGAPSPASRAAEMLSDAFNHYTPLTPVEMRAVVGSDNPVDVRIEATNSVGGEGWSCGICKTGGTVATEKLAFDADRAHCATVEHDRNTERMLRGNVKSAQASVETAREKLYDYLKSKGRVA